MKDIRVISVAEFNARSGKNWEAPKTEYIGDIPGYFMCYHIEVLTKDGKIDAGSYDFYRSIDDLDCDWEDFHEIEFCKFLGCKYTGNVVFRGYYDSHWDWEEREEYFTEVDLSDVINKYIVQYDDAEQYA